MKYDCVVQKYIERPLLIHDFKFDIRQWIVLRSIDECQEPTLWWYEDCYFRLASQPFSTESLDNPMVHLCNYSIQKDSNTYPRSEKMWTLTQFLNHFNLNQQWEASIQPAMQSAVKDVMVLFLDKMKLNTKVSQLVWFMLLFISTKNPYSEKDLSGSEWILCWMILFDHGY